MSVFTDAELDYLRQRRLARVATVGSNGAPHVTPVGMWSHNTAHEVRPTSRYFFVIDDLASTDPWRPAASRSAAAPKCCPSRIP